jgi:pSer/pThr/pTyr-binding forkhead associated (FHA) protein
MTPERPAPSTGPAPLAPAGPAAPDEPDHDSTIAQGTDAGIALPWPAAEGPAPAVAPARVASADNAALAQEPTPLLVRTSGEAGIVHMLGRRTTIGRTPDNDLRIEADYVSRHHCVVLVNPERAIVEDLNSTNGVYVNGARIMRHELQEGDVITIGDTSFRFVLKPASAQA